MSRYFTPSGCNFHPVGRGIQKNDIQILGGKNLRFEKLAATSNFEESSCSAQTDFTKMLKFVLPLLTVALTSAQSCVAVPKDKCGTKWDDNCLKCGDKSSFDCELCCPGCHTVGHAVNMNIFFMSLCA